MFLKSHQNVLNWKEKDESQSDTGERNLQRAIQGAKNSFHQYKGVVKKQNNTIRNQAPRSSVENLNRLLAEVENSSQHFKKITRRLFQHPLSEDVKKKFEASYETYNDFLEQSRQIITQHLQHHKDLQDVCPPRIEQNTQSPPDKNISTIEVLGAANGTLPFPAQVPTPNVMPAPTSVDENLAGIQKGDEPFLSHKTPTKTKQHNKKNVNIQDIARQQGDKIRQGIRDRAEKRRNTDDYSSDVSEALLSLQETARKMNWSREKLEKEITEYEVQRGIHEPLENQREFQRPKSILRTSVNETARHTQDNITMSRKPTGMQKYGTSNLYDIQNATRDKPRVPQPTGSNQNDGYPAEQNNFPPTTGPPSGIHPFGQGSHRGNEPRGTPPRMTDFTNKTNEKSPTGDEPYGHSTSFEPRGTTWKSPFAPTGRQMGTPTNPPKGQPMGPPTGSPMGSPDGSPMGPPCYPSQGPSQEPPPPGPPPGPPMWPPTGPPPRPPQGPPSGPPTGPPAGHNLQRTVYDSLWKSKS